MEYKTDAQRRMAEVLLSLELRATYYEADGFFIVTQGKRTKKKKKEKFLIHEGDFQDEEISGTLKKAYTCITFTPAGKMTYDTDGEKVIVKMCKNCGKIFLSRKPPEGTESCCPTCGQNSVMYLSENGTIPDWYESECEQGLQGLIDAKEWKKIFAIRAGSKEDKFQALISRLSGTPRCISLDEEKQQKIADLAKKFPNMQEPINYILQYAGTAALKQNKALSFRPFVLVGGPGCGKTAFVTELCKLIMDKQALKIDLGNEVADFSLTGCDPSFKNGKIGLITTALLADEDGGQTLKNPVIHMDKLDKVKGNHNYSVETVFYALLERCNARRFFDNYLGINIDASGINYIFTANTLEGIPKPIVNRLHVFTIQNYTPEELKGCVLDSFYENWLSGNDMEREYLPARLSDEVRERILEECNNDPRSIEDAIGKIFMETKNTDQESGQLIALFSSEEMSLGWKKFCGNKPISKIHWTLPSNFLEVKEDIHILSTLSEKSRQQAKKSCTEKLQNSKGRK